MAFKKYSLTQSQIKQLARLCAQQQGSVTGAKAEASLMANLLETSPSRQRKYGTSGNALYNFVRNGGWFYRAAHYMDYGSCSSAYVEAVRDVLVNGNRTLPQYVDEHDAFSDISSISTGSIRDRSDYIKNKTIIRNKMGSTYTFYCFPTSTSDPFGYTAAAYNYVKEHGGDVTPDVDPTPTVKKCNVTCKMPVIRNGSRGDAVKIWQLICGTTADGIFGANTESATKTWQKNHNLTNDGIVGTKTWSAGLNFI